MALLGGYNANRVKYYNNKVIKSIKEKCFQFLFYDSQSWINNEK